MATSTPKRYVVERFADPVFFREEHGIDYNKTTYKDLPKPAYDKLGGGRTEDLQEAQCYGWRKKPVFNPKCERVRAVRLVLED